VKRRDRSTFERWQKLDTPVLAICVATLDILPGKKKPFRKSVSKNMKGMMNNVGR
jgi:hypothetical protein